MLEHFSQFAIEIARLQKAKSSQSDFDQFCSITWQPAIDIFERDDAMVILVELPDVDRSSVHVTREGNTLRIVGNRPKRVPDGTLHVRHMEIPHGEFARLVPLPPGVGDAAISAEFTEHYLTVVVPKCPPHD